MSVRPWSNPDLELFHGTTLGAAGVIIDSGVDVRRSRPDCDFGVGFYCTTVERIARRRAVDKAGVKQEEPAIVHLSVPRTDLAALSSLSFVRGERDALDFWSLVHFFRNGQAQRPGVDLAALFPYDVVYGPIVLWRTQQPMKGSDQVSFHTRAAQELLNLSSTRRMITV
jgi:hypothetical protein